MSINPSPICAAIPSSPSVVPEHSCLYSLLPVLLKQGYGDPVEGADLAESQWLVHDFTSATAAMCWEYTAAWALVGIGCYRIMLSIPAEHAAILV